MSLNYCELGEKSSEYLQQILGFVHSKLEVLNIQGNKLQTKGCFNILRALEMSKNLKKINFSDNQIYDDEWLVNQLTNVLSSK